MPFFKNWAKATDQTPDFSDEAAPRESERSFESGASKNAPISETEVGLDSTGSPFDSPSDATTDLKTNATFPASQDAVQEPTETTQDATETTAPTIDWSPILNAVAETQKSLNKLSDDFQSKLRYDATKDAQISKLHDENLRYKDDLIWTIKKSVLSDVASTIDVLEKGLEYYRGVEATQEKYDKLLKYVGEVVEDLLYTLEKHDVVSYREPEGSVFNPRRQSAIEVQTVDDPTQDRQTKSRRRGYEYEGQEGKRIIQKEIVVCYRYEPKKELVEPQPESQTTPAAPVLPTPAAAAIPRSEPILEENPTETPLQRAPIESTQPSNKTE